MPAVYHCATAVLMHGLSTMASLATLPEELIGMIVEYVSCIKCPWIVSSDRSRSSSKLTLTTSPWLQKRITGDSGGIYVEK